MVWLDLGTFSLWKTLYVEQGVGRMLLFQVNDYVLFA